MIPLLVTVGRRRPDGRWQRLYVPVLPVVLVLSPLLVLAVLVGGLATRVGPRSTLRAAGQLLWALPGTRIEVAQGRTALLISVS